MNRKYVHRCTECKFATYVPTTNKNDPAIVYCAVLEKRLVARAARKCLSFKAIDNVDKTSPLTHRMGVVQ